MPTAPQYGRFYHTLLQSGAPDGVPTDGTILYDYTNKASYIAKGGVWLKQPIPYRSSSTAGWGVELTPATRPTGDYAYLVGLTDGGGSSSGLMTGGAAQKTYALGVLVNRPTASAATGDSNDAVIRGSYNNYAANDSNFIIRGINAGTANRSGGTLGTLSGGLISASSKSGSTSPSVIGAEINVENFGTNATAHIGADVTIKNEGAKATTQVGIRIRDLNNSIAGPSDAAILIAEPTVASTGFTYIIDANGVDSPIKAFARLYNGAVIYSGAQTTRNAVRTEVGTGGAIGSLYLSSAGKMYLKVNTAGADTDWEKVTTSAAD